MATGVASTTREPTTIDGVDVVVWKSPAFFVNVVYDVDTFDGEKVDGFDGESDLDAERWLRDVQDILRGDEASVTSIGLFIDGGLVSQEQGAAAAPFIFGAVADAGCTALARVPSNRHENIKRVLDNGAMGVIVPMVNSREEAESAVEAVLYPPRGTRSVGGSVHKFCIRHQIIVANYLDSVAESLGKSDHSLGIVFGKWIFDRDNWVGVDPLSQNNDHLLAVQITVFKRQSIALLRCCRTPATSRPRPRPRQSVPWTS